MKSIIKINIRFADIDAMGHVNNSIYLNYFEQGRMDFFDKLLGSEWDWNKDGTVVARNEIDYLHPAFLHDELELTTECTHVGSKSMVLTYEIHSTKKGTKALCAKGKSILVAFNYHEQQSQTIPEEWRKKLT
jgi:acyl-CoA thioester hydrolase